MKPFICKRFGIWLAVTIDAVTIHTTQPAAFDAAMNRTIGSEPTA